MHFLKQVSYVIHCFITWPRFPCCATRFPDSFCAFFFIIFFLFVFSINASCNFFLSQIFGKDEFCVYIEGVNGVCNTFFAKEIDKMLIGIALDSAGFWLVRMKLLLLQDR